jgi:hypothetical protein
LESCLNATRWWIEPAGRVGAEALAYGPERILVELVDGLAQRFGGGPVECSVHGRSVKAHLDWVRLVRRDERLEAHLQLSGATVDGFRFDRLTAVAGSLQIAPGLHPRFTLQEIEVKGRSDLDATVAWLGTRVTDWCFASDDGGAVVARHRRGAVEFEVEPSVESDRFDLALRAVRWRGRRLPVPAWLHVSRTVATLDLHSGVRVVEARRRGHTVDFELRIDSIDQHVELSELRRPARGGSR